MTGGLAWVLDMDEDFERRVNPESVTVSDLDTSEGSEDVRRIHELLRRHEEATDSEWAGKILGNWDHFMFYFRAVRPIPSGQQADKRREPRITLKVVK